MPLRELPVGVRRFHRNRFFDYQLNRLHALGCVPEAEVLQAAAHIRTMDDYVREFSVLAARAEAEDRLTDAAFYARAAAFFAPPSERRAGYERFIVYFDRAFADEPMTAHEVPFGDGALPARRLRARSSVATGTVVLFGGFDSIVEEFFVIWRLLADAGFDVIAFDGPGQGGARARHDLVFDHDWERPVGAVLDHFGVDDVTLIGLSMGGYWAIRAAAHEPRVGRVVAWPPVYDWLERLPGVVRPGVKQMLTWRRFMDASIRARTRLSPTLRYVVEQVLYTTGGTEPVDVVTWFTGMNKHHVSSQRVVQDVALMGGEHDAFQPPALLERQAEALTNARTVTARIFTAAERADQHCQMGNLALATEWLVSWLRGDGPRHGGA